MVLRAVGTTGLSLSELTLGTVAWGRTEGLKYAKAAQLPSDTQLMELLLTAEALGINTLDTAPAYGIAEERIGELLRQRPATKWQVSTKVGERFVQGQSNFDFSAIATRASVERSLRHLQRDRLDIVFVHSDGNDRAILDQAECVETLLDLKREGLIRAVGFSSKTIEGGKAALTSCDLVMVTANLLQPAEAEVIHHAQRLNKGAMIKKALASGHLPKEQFADNMRWLLSMPAVSSVVVGTTRTEHLHELASLI